MKLGTTMTLCTALLFVLMISGNFDKRDGEIQNIYRPQFIDPDQ